MNHYIYNQIYLDLCVCAVCINECCFVISWFNNMTHHYRYVSHYFIGSLIMTIAFSNEVNLGACNFRSAKVLIRVTAKVWIPYFLYYASKVICQYLYMVRMVLWFVFLLSKIKIRSYDLSCIFTSNACTEVFSLRSDK